MSNDELWAAAAEVLRANDLGGWTKPAPRLYPYQWSWDSAFIAIGLVHLDPARAAQELDTLFAAQWADGRIPHIVFNRDPDGTGLIVVYHPWESMDNSPRFDAALARVEVGKLPPYKRRDTGHIQDKSQRPTDAEYDRFLWLVNLLKAGRYDDAAVQKTLPLLVQDVFFSGIFAAANNALSQLGSWL